MELEANISTECMEHYYLFVETNLTEILLKKQEVSLWAY